MAKPRTEGDVGERLRVKHEDGGTRASQGTFLPPPVPLQPPAFEPFQPTYSRPSPVYPNYQYLSTTSGNRTATQSTYGGLIPNTLRFSQSPGFLTLPPPGSSGVPSTFYTSQSNFSTQPPILLNPPNVSYPAYMNSNRGQQSTPIYTNDGQPPALVVNEAYLDHLRMRFPLVGAHRKEIDGLSRLFPQLDHDYYLFDKIGEGTFSSVYKGVDVKYDMYDNANWDLEPSASDSEGEGDGPPPPPALVWEGEDSTRGVMSSDPPRPAPSLPIRRGPRIENEIEILHTLSSHPNIVGLITALRREDQIIVVTPYYRHHDFRVKLEETFQLFNYDDMRNYMRCLLKGLSFCHRHQIIHRDVKPSNFLYHLNRRRGFLADFGLAQRQEPPSASPVKRPHPLPIPHETENPNDPPARPAPNGVPFSYVDENNVPGVVKSELRPSIRANRAGTRGFRAPEVLLKVVHQTTAIDIWSAGVILLCMLSRRFPFFNSPNDQDALIEIGIIFGINRMQEAAASFDRTFLTNVPSVTPEGMTFEELLEFTNPDEAQSLPYEAIDLLKRLLEPCPDRRITADQALQHPFLT